MKKKNLIIALAAITAASTIAGCSSSSTTYGKYLKLGEYKGLEISKIKTEVLDDDIEYEIETLLEEYSEYNDVERGAKDGDELNIDFTCAIDGEESEDYSDTDYDLIIGSGDFGDEFEEQLIGAKAGDTVEVTYTFDDEYEDELVGKTGVFQVTVNSVMEIVVPELTDEFCQEYTDYATVDEYRESVRQELEDYYEESNAYTAGSDALYQVIENSEFNGYPQELYDLCKQEYNESNAAMAEMFDMDVEDFTSDEDTEAAVTELVNTRMVVSEIAEKENLTVSDEEYTEYVNDIYEEYGYSSVEEYEEDYSKESTMYEILYEKVADFLLENGNVTEVTEDEYYEDYYSDYEDESDLPEDESEDLTEE